VPASFNKVTLVGHLGRDPESKYLPSGDAVTSFSIATSERKKDGTETTTWFNVSAFGKLAETCNQYLRKGSYVYIEGRLTLREYTGKDGTPRTSLDVRASEMKMIGPKTDPPPAGEQSQENDGSIMLDIPF
jgi:single-strand DNA-binding protein